VVGGCGELKSYKVDKVQGTLVANPDSATRARLHMAIQELAVVGRFGYVVSLNTNLGGHPSQSQFSLDPSTGTIDPCCAPGFHSLHSEPSFTIPTPDGRFVYSNDWSGHVYTSALQPDGSLLDIGVVDLGKDTSFASAVLGVNFLAVTTGDGDPDDLTGSSFLTLAVDSNSGLLSPSPRASIGLPGVGVVTGGSTGYVVTAGNPAIPTWFVGASESLLRRDSAPIPTGAYPGLAVFDPSGRFLYVPSTDGIAGFAVGSNGALQQVSSYPSGTGPIAIIPR